MTNLDPASHGERDVLVLFQEQQNGFLRIIHLKPIDLREKEGGRVGGKENGGGRRSEACTKRKRNEGRERD